MFVKSHLLHARDHLANQNISSNQTAAILKRFTQTLKSR